MKLIIEFTGPAGSGKTYISEKIAEKIIEDGQACVIQKKLSIKQKTFMMLNFRLVFKTLFMIFKLGVKNKKNVFRTLISYDYFLSNSRKGYFVTSEGLHHKAVQIAEKEGLNFQCLLQKLWIGYGEPNIIVVLECEPKTLLQNRKARGLDYDFNLKEEQLAKSHKKRKFVYNKYLKDDKTINSIFINTSNRDVDIQELFCKIQRKIRK